LAKNGDESGTSDKGETPQGGFLEGLFGNWRKSGISSSAESSSAETDPSDKDEQRASNPEVGDPDRERRSADVSGEFPKLRIYSRDEHDISRKKIDRDALKALYRLHDKGHKSFLVGGAVRDIMIGKSPKDFDIATSATPQQVKKLFRNCRIIGRRFRLAHLYYAHEKILEVATFRSSGGADEIVREGELIRRDNVYGTPEEDARRRDLTINGLFYDIGTFSVLDYVGGVDDLRNQRVRMIGDPSYSFREDPVRLLRAIRHSTRLGFQIEEQTREALIENREEILKANRARLLEEFLKDLVSGKSAQYFGTLRKLGLLQLLMPDLDERLDEEGEERRWLELLGRVDSSVAAGERILPAQALAALIGPFVEEVFADETVQKMKAFRDRKIAFREHTQPVLKQLKVYKRDEDRLWAALGGLHRVAKCHEWEELPPSLERKYWLLDALQVCCLLDPENSAAHEWLAKVRPLELDSPPEVVRRRKRPRQNAKKSASSGNRSRKGSREESADQSGNWKGRSRPARRRRRRRRSPQGDNSD